MRTLPKPLAVYLLHNASKTRGESHFLVLLVAAEGGRRVEVSVCERITFFVLV